MAMWTNGSVALVGHGLGVARIGAKNESTAYRFPVAKGGRRDEPPMLEIFAVLDDDGTTALARRHGEALQCWTHDAKGGKASAVEGGDDVFDLVSTAKGRLVAVTRSPASKDRMAICAATFDEEELKLGDVIDLGAPKRCEFDSALFATVNGWPEDVKRDDDDDADELPPFDARDLNVHTGQWRARVSLFANRFGVGVSSTYNGLVAVLDAETLKPRFAVRVPSQREQFDIFVLPLPKGALVTLVANYRHTEYVYIDDRGKAGGARSRFGKDLAWGAISPGIAWTDDSVLVNQSVSGEEVHTLTIPGCEAKRFGKEPRAFLDSASNADGSVHFLAFSQLNTPSPQNWQLTRWKKSGAKWTSSEVELPDLRASAAPAPAASAAAGGAKRADGTPSFGVVADSATPWRGGEGKSVTLRVNVGNRGGAAKGVYVEIAGAAIEQGLVSAIDVRAESGTAIPFELRGGVARAELPDVPVEAGYAAPEKKGTPMPPQPIRVLEVRVKAAKQGQGIMTVRVGPRGATGSSGSAMAGRSFVVE